MIGQTETQRREVATLSRIFDLGLIKEYRLAIDGGAHVGTWSAMLARRFKRVLAFEPTPETFEMLSKNMATVANVECHNEALMNRPGFVEMRPPRIKRQKLTSRVAEWAPSGSVRAVPLDHLDLAECGLIKLDLEGAEPLALNGAANTLKRCRPVLVVEITDAARRFGYDAEAAHGMVIAAGYREIFRAGVDRVYSAWDRS